MVDLAVLGRTVDFPTISNNCCCKSSHSFFFSLFSDHITGRLVICTVSASRKAVGFVMDFFFKKRKCTNASKRYSKEDAVQFFLQVTKKCPTIYLVGRRFYSLICELQKIKNLSVPTFHRGRYILLPSQLPLSCCCHPTFSWCFYQAEETQPGQVSLQSLLGQLLYPSVNRKSVQGMPLPRDHWEKLLWVASIGRSNKGVFLGYH